MLGPIIGGSYTPWSQQKGQTLWWRACSDCTSEGSYSDPLCFQRVTSLHLFMSQPIHIQYLVQLMPTKCSSIPNLIYCQQTYCIHKLMQWCDYVDVTPLTGHSVREPRVNCKGVIEPTLNSQRNSQGKRMKWNQSSQVNIENIELTLISGLHILWLFLLLQFENT